MLLILGVFHEIVTERLWFGPHLNRVATPLTKILIGAITLKCLQVNKNTKKIGQLCAKKKCFHKSDSNLCQNMFRTSHCDQLDAVPAGKERNDTSY